MTTEEIVKMVRDTAFYIKPEQEEIVFINTNELRKALNENV